MDKRELIHNAARESIRQRDYTGAYVIAPRVGKTKIVIDAIGDKFMQWEAAGEIIVATPREDINRAWFAELDKWNNNMPNPQVMCFPSLKKVKHSPQLLIIDEFQALSVNQMHQIKRINPHRLLLVTGTANDYTKGALRYYLGVEEMSMEYTIEQAITDGIISNFHVYIVKVPLEDKRKYTKVHGYSATEKQAYIYYSEMFEQMRILSRTNTKYTLAKEIASRKRAEVIYGGQAKADIARSIQERISERVLVFTARTAIADKLSPYSYHSKNKKDKNLQKFIDGEINTLSVVQMSDMGITFPDLKMEVVHQLQSNSETSLQKFLRTCNLEGDKEARIIVTVYGDTVDEGWAIQATEGVPSDKVSWVELKELDELMERLR